MASASFVLCSIMDQNNCYAGDDKNETLTPSNTKEQTFLTDIMNPITINEVSAKHKDYIVIATNNTLDVCEVGERRCFEVDMTNTTITFKNMINPRGVYSSAATPPTAATHSPSDPMSGPAPVISTPRNPHTLALNSSLLATCPVER